MGGAQARLVVADEGATGVQDVGCSVATGWFSLDTGTGAVLIVLMRTPAA